MLEIMSFLSNAPSGNSTEVVDLMNKLRLDLREKNLDSSGEKHELLNRNNI